MYSASFGAFFRGRQPHFVRAFDCTANVDSWQCSNFSWYFFFSLLCSVGFRMPSLSLDTGGSQGHGGCNSMLMLYICSFTSFYYGEDINNLTVLLITEFRTDFFIGKHLWPAELECFVLVLV